MLNDQCSMTNDLLHKPPLTPGRVFRLSLVMTLVLLLVGAASLLLGTAEVSLHKIVALVSGTLDPDDSTRLIILKIRLPRIILAGLAGFSLALGGVVFQALLRNPLADPFILGVSSGSAFGAIVGMVLGFTFSAGIPLMSFAGALLTVYLVLALGTRRMGMESSTILLTGVILNAFFTAVIMFFISIVADSRLHTMLFWLYGDLSQSRYASLIILTPALIVTSVILFSFAKELNLITTGEAIALQLGVDVEKAKTCLVLVSLVIGLVVLSPDSSVCGAHRSPPGQDGLWVRSSPPHPCGFLGRSHLPDRGGHPGTGLDFAR
jgi:iron complex transport system permease protein